MQQRRVEISWQEEDPSPPASTTIYITDSYWFVSRFNSTIFQFEFRLYNSVYNSTSEMENGRLFALSRYAFQFWLE